MKKSFFIALLCAAQLTWATEPVVVLTDSALRAEVLNDEVIIQLGADIDLSNTTTLSIPKNTTVTIDLNGHKLDRNLTERGKGGGQVITVRSGATLFLINGTLAGGWGGNAGGIANESGSVTLTNVTITGCVGDDAGGGIINLEGGTLTMTGGAITNNTCIDKGKYTGGAGIFNAEGATAVLKGVTISGNQETTVGGAGVCNYGEITLDGCTITGNKAITVGGGVWNRGTLNITGANTITGNVNAEGKSDNLFLRNDDVMLNVTGDLTGSQIGIMLDMPRTFTTGYSANNTAEPNTVFIPDLPTMVISKQDGEAAIGYPDEKIYYVECSWDAENKRVVETIKSLAPGQYTLLQSSNQTYYKLTDEFYVVQGTVNVEGLWIENKHVHIILCNGSKLNFREGGEIQIRHYNTLYIHEQPNAYNNQGKLVMGADGKADGIGQPYQEDGTSGSAEFHGGDIRILACHDGYPAIGTGPAGKNIPGIKYTFYGGNYYLQGGICAAGLGAGSAGDYCGEITIYGGNIEAIGSPDNNDSSSGAGIGGGSLGTDGTINIYGGKVIARGGHEAAGIGTSQQTDAANNIYVNIYGGYVEARGDNYAAGIGGGDGVKGCNVEIYGGEVYAYGGIDAAGIGGGEGGDGGSVNIYGGYVYAKGGNEYGAGIGGGEDGAGAIVQIFGGTVVAKAGSNQTGCRAIGPGHGCERYGALFIGDDLMVSSERKAVTSERKAMCWYRTQVRVEPCDHKDITYTVDGTTAHDHHTSHCPYCGHEETGLHCFEDGKCTVCGVQGTIVKISTYSPDPQQGAYDGKTYRNYSATYVIPFMDYLVPECIENVPGFSFIGWELSTEPEQPYYVSPYTTDTCSRLYQPGEYYNVPGPISFVARYKVADVTLFSDTSNAETLNHYDEQKVTRVTLSGCAFNKNNVWQPIALPFSLSADELAASPLAGCELKQMADTSYLDAENNVLHLYFENATAIAAGVPYLIRWTSGNPIISPVFENVTLTNKMTDAKGKLVLFKALFSPQTFVKENKKVLYFAEDGSLVNPDGQAPVTVGAFRAYFRLTNFQADEESGEPLTISTNIGNLQDIEGVQSEEVRSHKVIYNGMLFIERNGKIYNANGIKIR
jgi:hypothetical protein